MSDNQGYIKPTAELIRQYLEGTLDDKTMHALEKQALDDPFLAEALEGYGQHQPDQRPALKELRARLEDRVKAKPKVRRFEFRWLAAAAVLLFISIAALYLINQPRTADIAQVAEPTPQDSANATPAPAAADEAPAETTAADTAVEPVAPAPAPETADNALSLKTKEHTGAAKARQEAATGRAHKAAARNQARQAPPAAKQAPPTIAAAPRMEAQDAPAKTVYADRIDTIRIGRYATDTTSYAVRPPSHVEGKIAGAPNTYRNYLTDRDERIISGVVTDAGTGQRLRGVAVTATGTTRAAVTDTSGNFALKVGQQNHVVLDFSMAGYQKKNVLIAANADSQVNVQLPASNQALGETVVVGYGRNAKQQRTGAVSKEEEAKLYGATGNPRSTIMIRGTSTTAPQPAPYRSVSEQEYDRYLESRRKIVIPGLLENKSGQVRLAFTVTAAGELKNFIVIESMGDVANKAAIRIVQEGPKWLPAPGGRDGVATVTVPLLLLKQE